MMSNFTNSPLVTHTRLSPHRNSPRNQPIRKITVHHFASTATPVAIGNWFANPNARASYNYGVGSDGSVSLYVNERDRCWGSSSASNDHQAVVIGVQNSSTGDDWAVSDRAFNTLIELIVDICRRNNIRTLSYTGNSNGTLTRHNMFSATACPGRFLQSRFPEIARRVNEALSGAVVPPTPPPPPTFQQYRVRVTALSGLNIRSGAGNTFAAVGGLPRGSEVTVISESTGAGARRWGRVQRGTSVLGWVALQSNIGVNWVKRI